MLLDRGLRMAGNVRDLIGARVGIIATLNLGAPALTQALDVERVSELQQSILGRGQRPEVGGRWTLETLGSLERR